MMGFILGAPLTLVAAFLLLFSSTFSPPAPQVLSAASQISPATMATIPSLSSAIVGADARPLIIKNYLKQHRSPLEPFAELIVTTSDRYLLDYRLLVAIAQQESNLCKKIPAASHNCWGFGIYAAKVTRFDSYPVAIETVARTIKEKYIDHGLTTPEKIMAKYAPPSVDKGGPWARGIHQFLAELE